jgi:hypothetical protein
LPTDHADASGVGQHRTGHQGPPLFVDERQEAILAQISREGRVSVTSASNEIQRTH